MNPIAGLFETHLNARDLERSMQFYRDVLGLELGCVEPARRLAIHRLGGRGEAMSGLREKPVDRVQRQHSAFRATLERMRTIRAYLTKRGLAYRNVLVDGTNALNVCGWMPAVSVHPDDPQPEPGVIPWARWERPHDRGEP